jgi:hypothetical protein
MWIGIEFLAGRFSTSPAIIQKLQILTLFLSELGVEKVVFSKERSLTLY